MTLQNLKRMSEFIIQLRNISIKGIAVKIRRFIYIPIILALASCSLLEGNSVDSSHTVSIHDIQGCGHISPFEGNSIIRVNGIVTWKTDKGFFMQDPVPDEKECSSEGIFVFTKTYPEVIPGDQVKVSGKVSEFTPGNNSEENLTITEIVAEEVILISANNDLPEPVVIGMSGRIPPTSIIEDDQLVKFDPQTDGLDFYESLEGMRVEVASAVVVEARNSYDEIFVIPADMVDQNRISEDGALLTSATDCNPERILVEIPSNYKKKIQIGDWIDKPIIGILDYEYGNYRIVQNNLLDVVPKDRIKPGTIDYASQGVLRVATYNVNNFSRFGEDKLNTLASQIDKYLGLPDILVMQEVQDDSALDDDGVTSAEKNLRALISNIFDNSDVLYHYVDPEVENNSSGGAQGGNIRTVILYRNDRGLEWIENANNQFMDDLQAFSNSRIPTIVKFRFEDKFIYIIGVHLVSNNLNSPLFGAIQPIVKPEQDKRIEQAQWIGKVVSEIKDLDPEAAVIVLGDFNDTPWSATMEQLTDSGLINTTERMEEKETYSFTFEGNASLFDQILVTPELTQSILTVKPVHINTWKQEEDQISDHDPILIDLVIE